MSIAVDAPTHATRARSLSGRQVLAALIGFFVTVFGVNGAMMYWAISTYSGVVANEPYRKGLHYNDRISADQRQRDLHWSDTISIDRSGTVTVSLTRADNSAVGGLTIEALVGRPSTNSEDIKLGLSVQPDGRYGARMPPLQPGNWLVAIEARSPGTAEPVFRARRRIWITP